MNYLPHFSSEKTAPKTINGLSNAEALERVEKNVASNLVQCFFSIFLPLSPRAVLHIVRSYSANLDWGLV